MPRTFIIPLTLVILLITVACGGGSTSATPDPQLDAFDPANFTDSTTIDNTWFPLKPGDQWTYQGFTQEEDGTNVPHRIIFTVTDLTKEINGVQTVVIWERDYSSDELVEAEVAFFAQDDDGVVWRLGEYPEEYENGEIIDTPAWIPPNEGAAPGIYMPPNPQAGTPSFPQGWGPAVDWTDRGQIVKMGDETCVPADCYQDVMIIEEFSEAEPNAYQLKYYAPGVGIVRVGWRGEDASKENLELVEFIQLAPEQLAEARAAALALEQSAYQHDLEAYNNTPPMQ